MPTADEPNGRYRRLELVRDGAIQTWTGIDRTLERPVTIRRAESGSEVGHRLRLQAQTLAYLEHRGLLHILDTYDEDDAFCLVTEQLPSQTLADRLDGRPDGGGPMTPLEATQAAIEAAEAVAALHDAGFAHGGIEAARLGIRPSVGLVLLDGPPTDDPVTIPVRPDDDIAAFGMLIHQLIAAAPAQRGADGSWQFDAAVPERLTFVLTRALEPELRWPDMQTLLLALRTVAADLTREQMAESTPRASLWQAERNWLLPVAALITTAGVFAGIATVAARVEQIDATGPPPSSNAVAVEPSADTDSQLQPGPDASVTPEITAVTVITPAAAPSYTSIELASVIDFDPFGNDGVEHPERLAYINDGNPAVGWNTARYRTSMFGGLKEAVGLMIVLVGNEAQTVDRVVVDSPTVGWGFSLYAAPERNLAQLDNPGAWGEPVAELSDIRGTATAQLDAVTASVLLLWITDLGEPLLTGGHRTTITGIDVATLAPAGPATTVPEGPEGPEG